MSVSPPLLTIITVSFHDLERLKCTIESLATADRRIEHVIVLPLNDFDSVKFLERFMKHNPNSTLRYVHDKGQGIYQAMTIGVAHVRSKYFTFWNSGDRLYSHSELVVLLNKLPSCDANWILTNGHFTWTKYPAPSLENLLSFIRQEITGYISHQCILFKKSYYSEGRIFDLTYRVAADTNQIYQCYRDSTPAILDMSVVSVEIGAYSSAHHRRSRMEVLLIILRQLRSKDLFLALYNFTKNNLQYFLSKYRKFSF